MEKVITTEVRPTEELVAEAIANDSQNRRDRQLHYKPNEVIDFDPRFPYFEPGKEFPLQGEAFLPGNFFMGKRTVFLEEPEEIDGTKYYTEIKGFGENGQKLYAHKHEEGDLWFGMFFDNAKREFEYPRRLRALRIENIQQSVALLKFDQKDFVELACEGLADVIASRLFVWSNQERVTHAVRALGFEPDEGNDNLIEERKKIGREIADMVMNEYESGGIDAVRDFAQKYGLEDELAGITADREAGFVIRAVKSPIRVGDLNDEGILTEGNKTIARQVGYTFRQMLEHGYLHTSPNPGNMTTEGELVDFEDVALIPKDREIIEQVMKYREAESIEELMRIIMSSETIGYLAPDFQTGFMGEETEEKEAVEAAMSIFNKFELTRV